MGISDLFSILNLIFFQRINYKKKKVRLDNFIEYFPETKNNESTFYFLSKIDETDFFKLKNFFLFDQDNIKNILDKGKKHEGESNNDNKIPIKFYNDNKKAIITIEIDDNKKIFGLGSKFSPFDRKGMIFDNFNTDNPYHAYFVDNLYSTLNIFYIFDEKTQTTDCLILDYPGIVRYDFGKTCKNQIRIEISSTSFQLIIFKNYDFYSSIKKAYEICNNFYRPPFHAFGYTYSHWGIKSINEIEKITKSHEEENIPLSNICLDIDYMDSFKNFTINENYGNFIGFSNFCKELKNKNIFLIPIIDAAIKFENGYAAYDEFKNKGNLVKNKNGNIYYGNVWPGKSVFPDFFDKKDQIVLKNLIDDWIKKTNTNGCWLDMNEPSIFNEKTRTFSEDARFLNGKVENEKLHNMYPYFQAKVTYESYIENNIRPMIFSRSFYTFMNQYCGNWTGDNQPRYLHLKTGFQQIISLSLSLVMYCGTDIGGFWFNPTNELFIKWFKACLFQPLFRNHSSIFAKPREIPSLKPKVKEKITQIIKARYALLPSIYSLFMLSIFNKKPYIMPYLYKKEDKFILSDEVIIISDTIGYDPFGTNLLKRDDCFKKFIFFDEVDFYIKKGKGIFLSSKLLTSKNIFETFPLKFLGAFDENNKIVGEIYFDDGITSSSLNNFAIYKFIIEKENNGNIKKNFNKTFSNLEKNIELEIEKLLNEIEVQII